MQTANLIKHNFNSLLLRLLLLSLVAVVSACSSRDRGYEGGRLGFPDSGSGGKSAAAVVRFMPWEIWPLGTDLRGSPLRNPFMRQGDTSLRSGQRAKALESYSSARATPLAPSENEALVIRLASTELALDQPNKALTTLSNYFRTTGQAVDDVDARFSILFGYAYGRRADVDQSLAWFSRAARLTGRDPGLRDVAEQGARSLLRTIPEVRLAALTEQWNSDVFVRPLVGEERSRRSGGGGIDSTGIFGTGDGAILAAAQTSGGPTTVGVLLPLTGQFANLGRSVKNGIDLALQGVTPPGGEAPLRVVYRDAGGGVDEAVEQARQLVSTDGATVLLGPLLSEHAFAVGDLARRSQVPLVSLAKNANFTTGEGIFRLGATSESQVRSLLETCQNRLFLKTYALVYPDDAIGRELADVFRVEMGSRGLALVYESSYPRGNDEVFVSIAQSLEAARPEAIFVPDTVNNASRFFSALAPAAREQIRPLGAASWDSPVLLANSSAVMQGAVFVSPYFFGSPRPAISLFNEAYKAAYGQNADFLAAQGFDALTVIADAVRRQRAEGASFTSAMRQLDTYDGLTGRITVRPDGELERMFSVLELFGGKIREIPEPQVPTFTDRQDSSFIGSTTVVPLSQDAVAFQGSTVRP